MFKETEHVSIGVGGQEYRSVQTLNSFSTYCIFSCDKNFRQFRNNLISIKQVLIQFEYKITMSGICASICSRLSI